MKEQLIIHRQRFESGRHACGKQPKVLGTAPGENRPRNLIRETLGDRGWRPWETADLMEMPPICAYMHAKSPESTHLAYKFIYITWTDGRGCLYCLQLWDNWVVGQLGCGTTGLCNRTQMRKAERQKDIIRAPCVCGTPCGGDTDIFLPTAAIVFGSVAEKIDLSDALKNTTKVPQLPQHV